MESCRSSNRLLWTLTRSCIREPKHPGVNATTHRSFIFGVVHHGGEPTGMLMKTRLISAAEMNFFRGFKKYWREERNVRGEKRFYARIETGSRCCQSWWAHSERATALGKRILREHVFIVLSITLFCWFKETYQKGKDSGPCQRTCISTPSQWTPGSLCISPPSVWSLRDSTCERPPRPASGNTNVFVRGSFSEDWQQRAAPHVHAMSRIKISKISFRRNGSNYLHSHHPKHPIKCVCSCVLLIPAPAEVAAQPSSSLHISFHPCSCLPVRRHQRTSRPRLRGRSRCRKQT